MLHIFFAEQQMNSSSLWLIAACESKSTSQLGRQGKVLISLRELRTQPANSCKADNQIVSYSYLNAKYKLVHPLHLV